METLDELLLRIVTDADKLGLYLCEPLPIDQIDSQARAIEVDLGVTVPNDYIRLMRVTNGIQTPRGDLCSLNEIRLQNFDIWDMDVEAKTDTRGNFAVKYTPCEMRPVLDYLWLGYAGNHSEQVYDLASGEFHRRGLGCGPEPDNKDRTFFGLLQFMVNRE